MSARLSLPPLDELPKVILFHREHPADEVIVLQVPMQEGEDSQTYYVRLTNEDHKAWLKTLPHNDDLTRILSYATHIAYFPHNDGYVRELKSMDEVPAMKRVMAQAKKMMDTGMGSRRLVSNSRFRGVSPIRSRFGRRRGF